MLILKITTDLPSARAQLFKSVEPDFLLVQFLLVDGTSIVREMDGCTSLGLHSILLVDGVVICLSFFLGCHTFLFSCDGLRISSLFSYIFFLGAILFFCSLFVLLLGTIFSFSSGFFFDSFGILGRLLRS